MVLVATAPAWAANSATGLPIRDLAVLADAGGQETLESVMAPARQAALVPVPAGFSGGYTRQVHWFRFTVPPLSQADREVWLEVQPPYLDDLRLYAPDIPGGALLERRSGDQMPFGNREVAATGFVFRLSADAVQGQTLWLRLQTSSSSLLLLNLQTPQGFAVANGQRLAAFGIYYGALLVLIALCLWQGAWRHDLLHRAYLVSLLGMLCLMFCINGLPAALLPETLSLWGDPLTSYAALLSGISANWFFRYALDLQRHGPGRWIWWLNRFAIWAYAFGLLSPALGRYTEVASALFVLTLCTTLVGLGRSVWLWRAHRPGSRFLALAHISSLSGVFSIVLMLVGAVPGQLWLLYSSQISSVLTMAAFGMVVVLRRQGLEAAHREASARAEQATTEREHERAARREQSRFVAMLSHEIRTPLAMIDGAVQALAKLAPPTTPEVERRYERIRRGVSRIDHLLQQVLDQDRLDDSGVTLRPSTFDAAALCADVREACDAALRVQWHPTPHALPLHADRALLAVALGNLLNNAMKYAPANTPVELTAEVHGEQFQFSVADRGPGIAPDVAGHLFERYTRSATQGDIPGSGLGLYIVHRIASLHGGQVSATARHGGGTVFCLHIPLHQPALP